MTVTAIEKRKRQARYDVYLDGEKYVTLSEDAILSYRLRVGMEVEPQAFSELVRDAERQDAVNYVLSALSTRAYTRKGARDKLKERGFSPDAVEFAMQRMEYYGYIDDEAYCRDYIEECRRTRSNRRIKQDLWEKGIPADVVERHLAQNDEHDACLLSLSRKAKGKELIADFLVKLTRYLTGQGFEYDVVRACIEEYKHNGED